MTTQHDMSDVVRIGLTKTAEADAIMGVIREAHPGVLVTDRGSYWMLEARGDITIDAEDVAEELGHDLTVEDLLLSFASYAGRAEVDGTVLRVTSQFLQIEDAVDLRDA